MNHAEAMESLATQLQRYLVEWKRCCATGKDPSEASFAQLSVRGADLEERTRAAGYGALSQQLKHLSLLREAGAPSAAVDAWLNMLMKSVERLEPAAPSLRGSPLSPHGVPADSGAFTRSLETQSFSAAPDEPLREALHSDVHASVSSTMAASNPDALRDYFQDALADTQLAPQPVALRADEAYAARRALRNVDGGGDDGKQLRNEPASATAPNAKAVPGSVARPAGEQREREGHKPQASVESAPRLVIVGAGLVFLALTALLLFFSLVR